MSENKSLLNQLDSLLRHKKSKKYYANKLGITIDEVTNLLKELRSKDPLLGVNTTIGQQKIKKVNVEKGTTESVITSKFEPKNHIQLAKLHKINLSKFKITNYWSKLQPNGDFTSSVFSKRKTPTDYTAEDFAKFLEKYKSNYIPISAPPKTLKDIVDVEVSIYDFHLAKKHVNERNLPSERAKLFFNTAQDLVYKARAIYDIDTIVFPISNDFFHTDNYQEQTTKGTPQDTIMEYDHEYELGFNMLIDTIKMLKANCINLQVILVQGNHDRTKSFYLAHALEVYFKEATDISFDRNHNVVKGVVLGETFIGYHHGNCKIDELPLLFATHPEFGKKFGDAKYREVHTGDKHHYLAKDIKGVRLQQMPSLSGADKWHTDNNFVHSMRCALLLAYDKNKGKITELETRI